MQRKDEHYKLYICCLFIACFVISFIITAEIFMMFNEETNTREYNETILKLIYKDGFENQFAFSNMENIYPNKIQYALYNASSKKFEYNNYLRKT